MAPKPKKDDSNTSSSGTTKKVVNRTDKSGNTGFGNSSKNVVPKGPQGQTPASAVPPGYKGNWKGKDWKESSPYNPKNKDKIPAMDKKTGAAQALPKVAPNRKSQIVPPAVPKKRTSRGTSMIVKKKK